jgi:hypothetical protein
MLQIQKLNVFARNSFCIYSKSILFTFSALIKIWIRKVLFSVNGKKRCVRKSMKKDKKCRFCMKKDPLYASFISTHFPFTKMHLLSSSPSTTFICYFIPFHYKSSDSKEKWNENSPGGILFMQKSSKNLLSMEIGWSWVGIIVGWKKKAWLVFLPGTRKADRRSLLGHFISYSTSLAFQTFHSLKQYNLLHIQINHNQSLRREDKKRVLNKFHAIVAQTGWILDPDQKWKQRPETTRLGPYFNPW